MLGQATVSLDFVKCVRSYNLHTIYYLSILINEFALAYNLHTLNYLPISIAQLTWYMWYYTTNLIHSYCSTNHNDYTPKTMLFYWFSLAISLSHTLI